jgi:hypothetical protein
LKGNTNAEGAYALLNEIHNTKTDPTDLIDNLLKETVNSSFYVWDLYTQPGALKGMNILKV